MARPRFEKLEPEKQERILLAAAVEFAQKGFDGASFNQIIEAAEISKGAAYYYFDDKSDMYTTVVEHAFAKLAAFFGDFSMDKLTAESFWETLEEYFFKSMQRAQQHPRLTALIRSVWTYAQNHPGAPGGQIVHNAARNWTVSFINRGQELGTIREDLPLDLLEEMFMGLGNATDHWVLARVDDMNEEEIARYGKLLTDIYRRICQPYEVENE